MHDRSPPLVPEPARSSGNAAHWKSWFSSPILAVLAAFFSINVLYVVKYGARIGIAPFPGVLGFGVVTILQCAVAIGIARGLSRSVRPGLWFGVVCLAWLVPAYLVYASLDPMRITLDRWSALQYLLDGLFQGAYPWSMDTHMGNRISGFPGLFLLAFPFYLMGDVGLLQFAAVIALVALAWVRLRDVVPTAFLFVILVGMPVFAYQILCRSDLFGNMVAAAWLLHASERNGVARGYRIVLWGIAWGLMLATRGIIVVPLILAAFPLLKGRGPLAYAGFGLTVAATFAATFLPFYLWSPELFAAHNPWQVQARFTSRPVLVVILLTTVWLGWKHRTAPTLFRDTGWILFVTITVSWILRSFDIGWAIAFWKHEFDVTYFSLCVPFLLLSLANHLPQTHRERTA